MAGDFNAQPHDAEMSSVTRAFADAMAALSLQERRSFPSACLRQDHRAGIAIDHAFLANGAAARAAVVPDDSCASDHDPVVAEVVLAGG